MLTRPWLQTRVELELTGKLRVRSKTMKQLTVRRLAMSEEAEMSAKFRMCWSGWIAWQRNHSK